jgi:hypothetical protein
MTIKKIKSVEQELLEKELMHSGKYGHRLHNSRVNYKRSKLRQELMKEITNNLKDTYNDEP